MRFIHVDQQVLVPLGAGQQALELLDKVLPPLRIGSSQQLLGFLPRQLEAMQGRSDRLATAQEPKTLAYPANEAAQCPARRWVDTNDGWRGGRALGRADHLAEFRSEERRVGK